MGARVLQKVKAGAEDILLGQGTVTQTRNNTEVEVAKVNSDKIPYSGNPGESTYLSIKDKLDAIDARIGAIVGTTVSTISGIPVTIFTPNDSSMYLISTWVNGGGASFMATATVIRDNTTTALLNYDNGANMTLTISGAAIQATQTLGTPAQIQYIVKKINS